jgi:kumamolisin
LKWTLETTGDIELIGALAPEAKIVIYFAPNSERGMLQALNTAIHDSENRPSVISCSWGNHEDEYSGPHVLTGMDSILQDAVLKGITLCFSSGDDGDGAGKDGKPRVEFPASSPHVLACGGTHMTISGNGTKETVWKEKVLPGQVWASGGGFSSVFEIPPWQASAGAMRRNHAVNKRGVPDVASKADITKNGYRVVAGGLSVCLGGGTSAAAPVWAALIANLNESLGRPVGYLTPLLYSDRFRRTTRDITRGNNGRYKAHTGWDACTGWGSPIGTALLAALRGM